MGAAAILTILKNGETIKTCPIEGEAVLGRGEGCVIRLEDRAISRQHALFRVVDGGVQVEKKSEFAPLVVNGADATRAVVRDADVISIGPYLLRVSLAKSAAAPQDAARPVEAPAATMELPVLTESAGDAFSAPSENLPGGELAMLAGPAAAPSANEGAPEGQMVLEGAAGAGDGAAIVPDLNLSLDGGALAAQPGEIAMVEEVVEQADDDAKTKLTPAAKLSVHLMFAPGTANVTDFELTQDEVSIGRGKNCDIVLNDKKASRKNAIIRRAGLSFTIKDLESANGTFVNGVRVQEQELSGDDLIKIAGVEFRFKALSADYAVREKDFMAVPDEPAEELMGDAGAFAPADGAIGLDLAVMQGGTALDPAAGGVLPGQLAGAIPGVGLGAVPGITGVPVGIAGITGIGPGDVKRMGFIEKVKNFKTLPKNEKIRVGLILAGLAFVFMEFMNDDDVQPTHKAKPKQGVVAITGMTAEKGPVTFAQLSPEKQRFVEAQHALAFDYYKNKDYDKSLYELGKIFALINDYKDSRDIERYALEGQRKLKAIEEEKKKKEEEAQLKAKVQSLVDECKQRMDKKQYDQAKELFTQISLLDPDNAIVAGWKKEIDKYEEDVRAAEQTKQVQAEINNRAWEVYKEGLSFKKQGKYHSAIETLAKVADIGASDPKPVVLARRAIHACQAAIKKLLDPVLAEAKTAEDAQDYPKAFALYKKATHIDPPHPAGYAGMARVRGILHDRAKAVYTEAVLAENFSDFSTAQKKFKECLDIAPADDIYHDRAERKLSRYFRRPGSTDGSMQ